MSDYYSKQSREFGEAIERALDKAIKHKPKSYKGDRLYGFVDYVVRKWSREHRYGKKGTK